MKVIPVVRIKDYEHLGERFDGSSIHEHMNRIDEKTLYIIDETGILKNHPMLDIYQKLASSFELWVDTGPRESGDIVDLVFSGVTNVIIRPSLWQEMDLSNIRSMTDQLLMGFQEISVEKRESTGKGISGMNEYDGFILYLIGDWKQRRFMIDEQVKIMARRSESYIYEPEGMNYRTWEQYGFTGLLVDIEHARGIKQ